MHSWIFGESKNINKVTKFLVIKKMDEPIGSNISQLINRANAGKYVPKIYRMHTWEMLMEIYKKNPFKGSGYFRYKDGKKHWVLPFFTVPGMVSMSKDVGFILNKKELDKFGWDKYEEL